MVSIFNYINMYKLSIYLYKQMNECNHNQSSNKTPSSTLKDSNINNSKQAIQRKSIKQKTNRIVKFKDKQQPDFKNSILSMSKITTNLWNLNSPEFKNSSSQKVRAMILQNNSILQANVSAIQGSSFISNRHDGSMDSMDQIIIGVGLDGKSFDAQQQLKDRAQSDNEQSRNSRLEIDFNQINQEYQQLFDRKKLLGQQDQSNSDTSKNNSEQNDSLEDNNQLEYSNYSLQKNHSNYLYHNHHNNSMLSYSMLANKKREKSDLIQLNLQKIQHKIQQVKNYRRLQDLSNNSIKILAGNLSQIHEQRQQYINNSIETDQKVVNCEEDQQDFYDFVSQPDPQETNNKQNKKTDSFERQNDQQWEEQSPMLQLLLLRDKNFCSRQQQRPVSNQNPDKHSYNNIMQNYKPILEALNSKEEDYLVKNQPQTKEQQKMGIDQILTLREQWVISKTKNKSDKWKIKQLKLITKIKSILQDYQYDDGESDDDEQTIQKICQHSTQK